jgi:hypothetical protein
MWKRQGSGYSCRENNMLLYYRSPATKFDVWSYDFEKDEWFFHPD